MGPEKLAGGRPHSSRAATQSARNNRTSFLLVFPVTALVLAVILLGGDRRFSVAAGDYVHALAMDADARTMFLGTHFGLFRSQDAGRSWKRVRLGTGHPHLDVLAIAPDPKDPLTIYIGTHEAGVLKSEDGGVSWREANSGLSDRDIHGLAVDPVNPIRLYAAVRGKSAGIYRTTNAGARWDRVDGGPQGRVRMLASVKRREKGIYLYASTAEGLERSADTFEGWQRLASLSARRSVNGLAVDPRDPNIMYVATAVGLFRSPDAAKSWEAIVHGPRDLIAVAINRKRPLEIYVLSGSGAMARSPDGGVTWESLQVGEGRT